LQAELARHGSLQAAAAFHGLAASTLQKSWRRAGLPSRAPARGLNEAAVRARLEARERFHAEHEQRAAERAESGENDDWLLAAMKRAGDRATVSELADAADVSPKRVRDALERLGTRGFRLEEDAGHVVLTRKPPASDLSFTAGPELFDGDLVRFGVVSDTHLGSKECHLQELHVAYQFMADRGIRTVLHPGDLVAGMGVYKHQIRDLHVHGFDNQVAYAIENYPDGSELGITTEIVGGNHDLEGDFGRDGADPVRAFCTARPDFKHLGDYSAWVDLPNGGRVHILHPGGGGSYALSYRAQKIAEGYEGGTKPNVTLFGHWHRRGDFTARGIQLLLCATFEGSTSLAKRYGLGEPAIGFHIVEARMADDGSLVEWNPRWCPFYRGRLVAS
jgi:predicted phosphodiesterase